jgi:hypothetical protein
VHVFYSVILGRSMFYIRRRPSTAIGCGKTGHPPAVGQAPAQHPPYPCLSEVGLIGGLEPPLSLLSVLHTLVLC